MPAAPPGGGRCDSGRTVRASCRLPKRLHDSLRRMAYEQNSSQNQIMVHAVQEYVRRAGYATAGRLA